MVRHSTYRRSIGWIAGLLLAAGWGVSEDHQAHKLADDDAVTSEVSAEVEGSTGSRWWLAPPAEFYPYAIADPRRPQSGLMVAGMLSSEIPESDGPRTVIRLGGRFALFRVHPAGDPDRGWQVDIDAGFFGHFDIDQNLDNIGWDGVYGLMATWKPGPQLALRFGTKHDSAHVGDEFSERTGRERIGYTRNEWSVGLSVAAGKRWRLAGEIGYDQSPKEFMASGRAQLDVEYAGRRTPFGDRFGWYAAADLTGFEETDWRPALTLQLGISLPTGRGSGGWRAALEFSDGRSALGEFFCCDESYVGLGLFYDF